MAAAPNAEQDVPPAGASPAASPINSLESARNIVSPSHVQPEQPELHADSEEALAPVVVPLAPGPRMPQQVDAPGPFL